MYSKDVRRGSQQMYCIQILLASLFHEEHAIYIPREHCLVNANIKFRNIII
jgi:hypothetical protein